MREKPFLNSS